MTNELITYYIPTNPNITKGPIYTLYLNKNTNLDLSSLLNLQTITINNIVDTTTGPIQETSSITISKDDYTKLLELNNQAYQLTTKRSADIQAFIQAETKTMEELTKINGECQELIKNALRKDKPNEQK